MGGLLCSAFEDGDSEMVVATGLHVQQRGAGDIHPEQPEPGGGRHAQHGHVHLRPGGQPDDQRQLRRPYLLHV